ncbi:hypothetical protein HanIR_Chr11g0550291 [Helianthus annuus]|nr:hypothetical protein HanIR_Chr11g0550291 [Helianthus annuus]
MKKRVDEVFHLALAVKVTVRATRSWRRGRSQTRPRRHSVVNRESRWRTGWCRTSRFSQPVGSGVHYRGSFG